MQHLDSRQIKVYIYHFPQMIGIPISIDLIARLLLVYPQNIVASKIQAATGEVSLQ